MTRSNEADGVEERPDNGAASGMGGYDEASRHTGIKKSTLYNLVAAGRVPHIRLGKRFVLFDLRDLDDWLATRKVAAK